MWGSAQLTHIFLCSLGDSGFMVLRPQPASDLPPTPPPSPPTDASTFTPPTPSVLYRLVHEQTPQIHFFNAPLQLSKLPAAERAQAEKAEQQGKWLRDLPRDADVVSLQLEDGDVVLLVTDGYSDKCVPSLARACSLGRTAREARPELTLFPSLPRPQHLG